MDEWEKLCNECYSLVKEANMTEKDINNIIEENKVV